MARRAFLPAPPPCFPRRCPQRRRRLARRRLAVGGVRAGGGCGVVSGHPCGSRAWVVGSWGGQAAPCFTSWRPGPPCPAVLRTQRSRMRDCNGALAPCQATRITGYGLHRPNRRISPQSLLLIWPQEQELFAAKAPVRPEILKIQQGLFLSPPSDVINHLPLPYRRSRFRNKLQIVITL